ncbi:MAG: hypothetical protein IJW59_01055 [Clostridia bacterium]|nr:hypothetical protein [Clostridia bacterium]
MRIKTELIINFMNKYDIKPYRLCRLCQITRHLKNVLENNKEASCYTLFQIAKFMETSILDLIEIQN